MNLKAEIFSDPAMPQAGSYLLRGRGLDSNQSDSAAMTSMCLLAQGLRKVVRLAG